MHGVLIACLYLPNGNPQPGPKFDYKLRWFECLIGHARTLLDSGHPTVLAGTSMVPTDRDIYNTRSWLRTRCSSLNPGVLPTPARTRLERCDPPVAS